MKKYLSALILLLVVGLLSACGSSSSGSSGSGDKKNIAIGATAGPYSDMVTKAIKPQLEKKGYKVKVVEFSDYVQPNLSLSKGSIDANLFQHKIYMENFAKEKNLKLSELISVPTAPMGVYSEKLKK